MIIPFGFVAPKHGDGAPIPSVPVASSLPTISGNTEGTNSTSTTGTWLNSPTSYARQWQVSANGTSGWADIIGATGTTYAILSGDVGKYIRVSVIATNAAGASAPAYSTGLLVVAIPSYVASVSLLLHMDGANGAQTFTDSSINNFAVTAYGNASIATSSKKFGTGAAYFDGSGDYLVFEDNEAFTFNTGLDGPTTPFTIEAWIYPTVVDSSMDFVISKDQYGTNYSWGIAFSSTKLACYTHNINGDWDFTVNANVVANQWQHVALTHDGTNQRLFLNGVLLGTKAAKITNGASKITIGCAGWNNPNSAMTGYIDELRIVKGAALYTNTFTPPTAAFDNPVSPWAGVLSSNYTSDIRAAYDFRDVSGSALAGIVGPELFCEGLTKVSAGAQFTYGQSQAYSNSTIAVSYPFTVVYYGKTATSTGGDMVIIHTQPTKWVQTSNTNAGVFSRTWQGLNPYNGNDNQSIPHVASTEAYFAAFSFLADGTVRYAIRKASGNLNGTKPANASAQPFNGYVMFGCGFTNGFKALTGTLGYALYIQKAFSTEAEMDALYATMPSDYVW